MLLYASAVDGDRSSGMFVSSSIIVRQRCANCWACFRRETVCEDRDGFITDGSGMRARIADIASRSGD
jgi:hypothetical protein